jgi:hypothetical protein
MGESQSRQFASYDIYGNKPPSTQQTYHQPISYVAPQYPHQQQQYPGNAYQQQQQQQYKQYPVSVQNQQQLTNALHHQTQQQTQAYSLANHPLMIRDRFTTLDDVQAALKKAGVEGCNLIFAIDFTE